MAETKATGEVLRVNMVTPGGPVTAEETDAVTAPGELGEFEILPGHIPFLTSLHPGVLILGETQRKRVFAVSRGYLRVSQAGVVEVLVEQAVAAEKVNTESATEARDAAARELEAMKNKPQDGEWKNAKDRHDWAQAQLDARAHV